MKKLFTLLLVMGILITGCTAKDGDSVGDNKDSISIALVTPEKIGVNPFFKQMEDGLLKAAEEFSVDTIVIESADHNAIEENLRAAVAEGYDLIITSSFHAEDALKKVASENPDKDFAIIDTVVEGENIRSVVFREHESSYLLGATAGLITKTDTVGMVVAMDLPLMKKWTEGFRDGLKSVNDDAKYHINYVGSFTDPAKAKELALLQNEKGADFIVGASAVGDLGVFEAAKEKGFYTSGQDIDTTVYDPEHIIMSQLKRTDTVVLETVRDYINGSYESGVLDYGIKEGGVGLTFVTHESESPLSPFIGEEVILKVKKIKDKIISGEIVVENPLMN